MDQSYWPGRRAWPSRTEPVQNTSLPTQSALQLLLGGTSAGAPAAAAVAAAVSSEPGRNTVNPGLGAFHRVLADTVSNPARAGVSWPASATAEVQAAAVESGQGEPMPAPSTDPSGPEPAPLPPDPIPSVLPAQPPDGQDLPLPGPWSGKDLPPDAAQPVRTESAGPVRARLATLPPMPAMAPAAMVAPRQISASNANTDGITAPEQVAALAAAPTAAPASPASRITEAPLPPASRDPLAQAPQLAAAATIPGAEGRVASSVTAATTDGADPAAGGREGNGRAPASAHDPVRPNVPETTIRPAGTSTMRASPPDTVPMGPRPETGAATGEPASGPAATGNAGTRAPAAGSAAAMLAASPATPGAAEATVRERAFLDRMLETTAQHAAASDRPGPIGALTERRGSGESMQRRFAVVREASEPSESRSAVVAEARDFQSAAATARPLAAMVAARDLGALAERVEMLMARGAGSARVNVNLGDLGDVEVSVRMEARDAHVRFVVQDAALRETLDAHLPRLRQLLEDSGLRLADVSTGLPGGSAQDSAGRNGFGGRSSSGDQRWPQRATQPALDETGQIESGARDRHDGQHLLDAFA